MNRKHFIRSVSLAGLGTALLPESLFAGRAISPESALGVAERYPELNAHKIAAVHMGEVNFHWPRLVGKNAKLDVHGQHHRERVLQIVTDKGATGWGQTGFRNQEEASAIVGKPLSELIDPQKGILAATPRHADIALFDLCGVVLNKPVYQLLGAKGDLETPVYSGMIYLDELEPSGNPAGLDRVIENCRWDYDYGYRQLKVKIGRSFKWYPHDKGLQTDIDIVNRIQAAFGKDTGVLVDANNGYSLDDAKAFMAGLKDVPLVWFEEPFHEEAGLARDFRKWMNDNGYRQTLYADGEYQPDHELCMQLGKEGILDVYLPDTYGYGFSSWVRLMPELIRNKTLASPHAWGTFLKTNYTAHLAAGLGNVVTIEGVTCVTDDVDCSGYRIVNGKLKVSEGPGFGMKLLKQLA